MDDASRKIWTIKLNLNPIVEHEICFEIELTQFFGDEESKVYFVYLLKYAVFTGSNELFDCKLNSKIQWYLIYEAYLGQGV